MCINMSLKTKILIYSALLYVLFLQPAVAQDNWVLVEGRSWTPDIETIQELKTNYIQFIKNESIAQGNPIDDPSSYSFQYQGRTLKGHLYIFINAFCESPQDWPVEEEMYFVLDGGKCYFQLKYDKRQNKFYGLVINGEA